MGIATIAIEDLSRVELRDRRYDACLCDPPYGLGFMGKEWDGGVPGPELWRVVQEAMKPGAYLLAFGGTRTWDYLAQALRKAGFEYCDTLMWLYGSGFPKGLDVGKGIDKRKGARRDPRRYAPRPATSGSFTGKGSTAPWIEQGKAQGFYEAAGPEPVTEAAQRWDGWRSALKPAWEPVLLVQKPIEGGIIDSALEFGTGALNIDGTRIGTTGGCKVTDPDPARSEVAKVHALGKNLNYFKSPKVEGLGRYPSNLLLDPAAAAMLDEQSGIKKSAAEINRTGPTSKNAYRGGWARIPAQGYGDQGGASRFFYIAKASPGERGDNAHPTLKPLRLCEYLARLILPPSRPGVPRRLLVPFSGSGSEMIGGLRAGFEEALGVEQDGEYAITAFGRLEQEGHEVRFL